MATFEDLKAISGTFFVALSEKKDMGGQDFLRKGLGGRQSSQTRAAIEAVNKTAAPVMDDELFNKKIKAMTRKATAAVILCGRIPAFHGNTGFVSVRLAQNDPNAAVIGGVGIAGPTVDAEKLSSEKRQRFQALRQALAEYYGLEELRKLYPRSSSGIRVSADDDAPETVSSVQDDSEQVI